MTTNQRVGGSSPSWVTIEIKPLSIWVEVFLCVNILFCVQAVFRESLTICKIYEHNSFFTLKIHEYHI